MCDHEFPEDYLLTVFPFTRDVSMAISKVSLICNVHVSRGVVPKSSLFIPEF